MAVAGQAAVKLPAIFSDHMVLQQSGSTPVWGKADPGEKILVTLDQRKAEAVTDAQGKWKVALDLKGLAHGPFAMTIEGKNQLVVQDVVVGEVWLALGQSNMEFPLKNAIGADKEVPASGNPLIRQFLVRKASVPQPAEDCAGQWVVATPLTTPTFSAIGYYFAKTLQKTLNTPVGIINATWGGSACEAWTSREGLAKDAAIEAGCEARWKAMADYPALKAQFVGEFAEWSHANKREDKHDADAKVYTGAEAAKTGWLPVKLPGVINAAGLPANGAIWLRKEITVPPTLGKEPFLLELGEIEGFDGVYWNGELLKETTPENYPGSGHWRRMEVPPKLLKEGTNVLAIRVYAPAQPVKLTTGNGPFKAGAQNLKGAWLAKSEYEFPSLAADTAAKYPTAPVHPMRPQDIASQLFNGMINPLIPYGIRGMIWYQGEANAGRAYQYRALFSNMITDWREKWGAGDLPFYYCQLPNFNPKKSVPGDAARAELREAQAMALKLPNTGQAVLIELGEEDDIHPRHKEEAAERLVKIALARDYGQKVEYAGPIFQSAKGEGDGIRISFENVAGGLIARPLPAEYIVKSSAGQMAPLVANSPGSEVEGFAICGEDNQWHWAQAKIDGGTVLVSSPEVPKPVAVRYAWAENPTCNLYSAAGLPAAPFRTDSFPEITRNNSY